MSAKTASELRAIDARVAVEVMGMPLPEWTPTHGEVATAYFSSAGHPDWYNWPWEITYWGDDKPIAWEPRPYTTSWDAMRLVVEKMRALGFDVAMEGDGKDTSEWCVDLYLGDSNAPWKEGTKHAKEFAPELPLAVSLAALEACKT